MSKENVKELEGLIKELVTDISSMKEKQEVMTEQLAAYKEMEKNGWKMPEGKNVDDPDYRKPYDLAKQGKELMDKKFHPKYYIKDDARREEIAKWWILFIKAAIHDNPSAYIEMENRYGVAKTAIGDSGNLFPLPTPLEEEIVHFAREESVVLKYARIWPMESDTKKIPTESASTSVSWGNTTPESEPEETDVDLSAEELSAYAVIRDSVLADTTSDIVSWLQSNLAEAAAQAIDNAAWNGDGTSTYASCYGLLSASCGYSVVMGSGSTAFSNLTASHLSEMIAKLDGKKKAGARFFMHGDILHYVRTLEDTNGNPVFMINYGGNVPPTIFNYPYDEVIKMPSTTAANTAFMTFGNLRWFGIGRRLNSIALKVDPYGLFTTNRTRFKLYQRWAVGPMTMPNGFVRLMTAAT